MLSIAKPILSTLLLTLAVQTSGWAASCGTVAAPTACTLSLNGNTQVTASNFNLAVSSGSTQYQASDILIDILAGGGGIFQLQFSKNASGPTPGVVFLANPGDTAAFSFTYDLALAPLVPGATQFTGATVQITESAVGNGFAAVQLSISGMPSTCQATTSTNSVSCVLPPGSASSYTPGNILQLAGNSGNASILNFRNIFDTSFTASNTAVPEPGSFALLSLGLTSLLWIRRPRSSKWGRRPTPARDVHVAPLLHQSQNRAATPASGLSHP